MLEEKLLIVVQKQLKAVLSDKPEEAEALSGERVRLMEKLVRPVAPEDAAGLLAVCEEIKRVDAELLKAVIAQKKEVAVSLGKLAGGKKVSNSYGKCIKVASENRRTLVDGVV